MENRKRKIEAFQGRSLADTMWTSKERWCPRWCGVGATLSWHGAVRNELALCGILPQNWEWQSHHGKHQTNPNWGTSTEHLCSIREHCQVLKNKAKRSSCHSAEKTEEWGSLIFCSVLDWILAQRKGKAVEIWIECHLVNSIVLTQFLSFHKHPIET